MYAVSIVVLGWCVGRKIFVFCRVTLQKDDLWTVLKENFTLPPEEDPEKPVKEQLIKSHALKKMADLFRRWKNELKTFVDKEETPEFIGRYE